MKSIYKTIKTGLMLALIAFSMSTIKASEPTPKYTHGQFADAFLKALHVYNGTFKIKDLKRNRASLLKAITAQLSGKSTPAASKATAKSTPSASTAAATVSAPVRTVPLSMLPIDDSLHTDDLMSPGSRFRSPIFSLLAQPTAHTVGAPRIGMPIIFRPHTAAPTTAPTDNPPSASSVDSLPNEMAPLSLPSASPHATSAKPVYGRPVATVHTDQKHSVPKSSAAMPAPSHPDDSGDEFFDNDPELVASVSEFLASQKQREEEDAINRQHTAAASFSAASSRPSRSAKPSLLRPLASAISAPKPDEDLQTIKNMIGIQLTEINIKRTSKNKKQIEAAVDKVLKDHLDEMGTQQFHSFESRFNHFKDNTNDCLGFLTYSNLIALRDSLTKINAAFTANTTRK